LIESLPWDIAARVLALGVNVVLDFGFWARSEREDYRARAVKLGASSELHVLNVPGAVLLARLAMRNAQRPPGTFVIPQAKLQEWIALFQVPTEDELQRRES
jgi:predicted kinase